MCLLLLHIELLMISKRTTNQRCDIHRPQNITGP